MQTDLGQFKNAEKALNLSQKELVEKLTMTEAELVRVLRENYRLRNLQVTDEQLRLLMQEQMASLRQEQFGASSERYKPPTQGSGSGSPKAPTQPRVKKLSERYPNIPIREVLIKCDLLPCPCCGKQMSDSGMTEDSEQLTVIPKKYEITLIKRPKLRCSCQGAVVTAPLPARIIPGSSYSDEMILDVALSKYCDLIPIERYAAMAGRGGLVDLPPQSLIELTHGLADFLAPIYTRIKNAVLCSRVLHADETPHRMLEGSDKKSWYLWGFSTTESSYLECRDTRSGDVASDILLKSQCEILVTDVYSGYGKAKREVNEERQKTGKNPIKSAYCNAHARRYFHKAWPHYKEAAFYLDHYHEIYRLNSESKWQPPPRVLELRSEMRPLLEDMKKRASEELSSYPRNGKYGKALRYFIDHYAGLTLFLTDADVPIDNNSQERLLRSHVVGRKTWYGTHSERGAFTAAVLFTVVETCKLNGVNPREYFAHLTADLHAGREVLAPAEFKQASLTAAA